jgi:hypothetical protein
LKYLKGERCHLPKIGINRETVKFVDNTYRADLGLDATLSRACQHPTMSGAFTVCPNV